MLRDLGFTWAYTARRDKNQDSSLELLTPHQAFFLLQVAGETLESFGFFTRLKASG